MRTSVEAKSRQILVHHMEEHSNIKIQLEKLATAVVWVVTILQRPMC